MESSRKTISLILWDSSRLIVPLMISSDAYSFVPSLKKTLFLLSRNVQIAKDNSASEKAVKQSKKTSKKIKNSLLSKSTSTNNKISMNLLRKNIKRINDQSPRDLSQNKWPHRE